MSFPQPEMPMDPMMGEGSPEGMQQGTEESAGLQPFLPGRPAEAVDYRVKLTDEKRKQLQARVCEEYENYLVHTEGRRTNADDWRRSAAMMPDPGGEDDWQSDAIAPYTRIACQNHSMRLNQQLLRGVPLCNARPKTETITINGMELPSAPLMPVYEKALTSILRECRFEDEARIVHQEIPIVCPCLVRVIHRREVIRVPTLQTDFDPETARLLMEAGVAPEEAMIGAAAQDAEGLLKLEPGFEEKVLHDGCELRAIPFEQACFFPPAAKRHEELWGIGERLRLRGYDLQRGAEAKIYDAEAVRMLLKQSGDGYTEEEDWAQDRSGLGGGSSPTASEEARYQEYDCLELCWLDDLDDDGQEEWYILTVHLDTQELLRCQYSPYEHGRPYYRVFGYLGNPLYGESIAEVLALVQAQGTAALQHFTDLTEWMANSAGSYLYERTAGLDPSAKRMRPGTPIACDRSTGIIPFPLAQNIPAAMQHLLVLLDKLQTYTELLTASSNPALGRETQTQKTLGEVNAVLTQAMQIFEDYASRVAQDWAAVVKLIMLTTAQYAEGGEVSVRADGATGSEHGRVPADLLRADVDLIMAGMNAYSDANARLQRDLLVLTQLGAHPLIASNPTVQASILKQTLQDVQWPGWEQLALEIDNAAAAQMQAMQMQAMLGLGQMGAESEAAEAEGRRADEKHQSEMQSGALGRAGQVKELLAPPEKPAARNGSKRK